MTKPGFGEPIVVKDKVQAAELARTIAFGKRLNKESFNYKTKQDISSLLGRK